jgi:hypothetical protein
MTAILLDKVERKLTLNEVIEKYPDVPRIVILKTDVHLRGVHFTDAALGVVDPAIHQVRGKSLFGSRDGQIKPLPASLLLKDGTLILPDPTPLERSPYVIDLVDGHLALIDNDELLEFVDLTEKPRYYDLVTTSGIPMKEIVTARPQRLDLIVSGYCHFGTRGNSCRFCDINSHNRQQAKEGVGKSRYKPQEISETIREALKEPGRFSFIHLTGGSVLAGDEVFDRELELYIETLQAIGENFATKKFPVDVTTSALNEKQLRRLNDETGIMAYTSDLEVLNEEKFNWVCPGKADSLGYKEWRSRLIRAVDIFGRGYVGTGIVTGVELAKPFGYTSEDEALRANLEEAEYLAEHGVTTWSSPWVVRPSSDFHDQKSPSLEYCIRFARGLDQLRVKYGLIIDFNDYRRCGNHPDTDLSRVH